MSETIRTKRMTIEEYLQFEESSALKHEYVGGRTFVLSGSTEAHNVICTNLIATFHGALRGTGCRVFANDMKVKIESAQSIYYPDVMVTCEPFQPKSVVKLAPILIIEILSPSTKQTDRREKLSAYCQLTSLQTYILVHQNQVLIELYQRVSGDEWENSRLIKADEVVLHNFCGKLLRLPLSTIYEGIDLPTVVKESEEEYEIASAPH